MNRGDGSLAALDVPPGLREFIREVAREAFPGRPTFASTAEEETDGGIHAGDVVIYVQAGGSAADGRTVVAVGNGGQITFGRAAPAGARIKIGNVEHPRHMVRGVVIAAVRKIDAIE